jgi:small-conductance mechanosensitive channel
LVWYTLVRNILAQRLVGLSWLIGSSLSDVLTCIIFLFVLHPFDVGDRLDVGKETTYTVKEIRLLSTILLDGHGTYVQVSNTVLNSLVSLIDVEQTD